MITKEQQKKLFRRISDLCYATEQVQAYSYFGSQDQFEKHRKGKMKAERRLAEYLEEITEKD